MGFIADTVITQEAKHHGFALNIRRGRIGLTGIRNAKDFGQLAGSTITVEVGPATSRTTATRVATGAVLGAGVGAIVGAVAKKNTSRVRATVSTPDGRTYTAERPAGEHQRLQRFANDYNARFGQS